MRIPRYFCWTRFGTEAAQSVAQIIERKEEERLANKGVFLWGVGNAVGPSIAELLKLSDRPEVLFSSIKSSPKLIDVAPAAVVAWSDAFDLDGKRFSLPERSLVTSRFDPSSPKKSHYALVCHSAEPLKLADCGQTIFFRALKNLRTSRPLGASQVTAIVEHKEGIAEGVSGYKVEIRARLVAPYFIRLNHAIPIRPISGHGGSFDFAAAREAIFLRQREVQLHQMPMTFGSF